MAKVWMPIKDGWHEDRAQYEHRTFHIAGDKLRVDERLPLMLGPSVRVCELVDQPDAPAGAGVLSAYVREAMMLAAKTLRYFGRHKSDTDAALVIETWLAEQKEKNGEKTIPE